MVYLEATYELFIGCHGGKHRSVAVAEMAAAAMREKGHKVTVVHRDLKEKQ